MSDIDNIIEQTLSAVATNLIIREKKDPSFPYDTGLMSRSTTFSLDDDAIILSYGTDYSPYVGGFLPDGSFKQKRGIHADFAEKLYLKYQKNTVEDYRNFLESNIKQALARYFK